MIIRGNNITAGQWTLDKSLQQPELDITADNCPGDGGVDAAEEKSQLRHGAARDERTEECKSCQVYPALIF